MGKKNPDLCEWPWCRERWDAAVHGVNRYGKAWESHLCDVHAMSYRPRPDHGAAYPQAHVTVRER